MGNRFKSVRLRCLKSMQLQLLVRSSSVFGLFLVAWTRPADTTQSCLGKDALDDFAKFFLVEDLGCIDEEKGFGNGL